MHYHGAFRIKGRIGFGNLADKLHGALAGFLMTIKSDDDEEAESREKAEDSDQEEKLHGGQRSESRGQKAESRRQKAEGRRQKAVQVINPFTISDVRSLLSDLRPLTSAAQFFPIVTWRCSAIAS